MANVCPICNNPLREYGNGFYVCDFCETYCDKDKNILLTEQEWLQTCDTEQLAEWFTNSGFLTCTLRDCDDCKYYDKNNDDCIDGYEATHDKQMWVEWLKQPHTNE